MDTTLPYGDHSKEMQRLLEAIWPGSPIRMTEPDGDLDLYEGVDAQLSHKGVLIDIGCRVRQPGKYDPGAFTLRETEYNRLSDPGKNRRDWRPGFLVYAGLNAWRDGWEDAMAINLQGLRIRILKDGCSGVWAQNPDENGKPGSRYITIPTDQFKGYAVVIWRLSEALARDAEVVF